MSKYYFFEKNNDEIEPLLEPPPDDACFKAWEMYMKMMKQIGRSWGVPPEIMKGEEGELTQQ